MMVTYISFKFWHSVFSISLHISMCVMEFEFKKKVFYPTPIATIRYSDSISLISCNRNETKRRRLIILFRRHF